MTRTNREMVQIFLPVVGADAPVSLFFGRSAAASGYSEFLSVCFISCFVWIQLEYYQHLIYMAPLVFRDSRSVCIFWPFGGGVRLFGVSFSLFYFLFRLDSIRILSTFDLHGSSRISRFRKT
ncbi:hypothetical protein AABB24_003902 [Solanum stoloniferum]|uniref:Uncharacterized protein n=1 Tax=Solanum stoloniferum TaxID=62892 RepID=A0ABD2V995_9SOLN